MAVDIQEVKSVIEDISCYELEELSIIFSGVVNDLEEAYRALDLAGKTNVKLVKELEINRSEVLEAVSKFINDEDFINDLALSAISTTDYNIGKEVEAEIEDDEESDLLGEVSGVILRLMKMRLTEFREGE